MSERIGLECKMYRNTGTYNSPTWNEITAIRDLTVPFQKGKADFSTRGTGGWRASRGTLKDFDVQGELVYDTADADFTALQDSFLNGTQLDILLLDGSVATPGSKGWRVQMEVFKFSEKEPLEGAKMIDIELGSRYDPTHPPVQYTAA